MSHIILRPLRFLVTCTSTVSSIPFVWDKNTDQIKLMSMSSKHKLNWRLGWWYLNIILMTIFTCYHTIRFTLNIYDPRVKAYEMVLHFFWVNMSINSVINQYCLYRHRDEMLLFINQYIHFMKITTERYCWKKLKTPLISFCELVIGAGYQHTCLATLLYLEDPTNLRYVYSLFCDKYEESTMLGIGLFTILEVYFLLQNWNAILIYACYMFVYISGLKFWMDEVCYANGDKLTKPALRRPAEMKELYRTMQVLNNGFNTFWRSVILPIHDICVIISTVICAYGAIRVYGKVKFLSYLSQPVKCAINTSYQLLAYPIAGRMISDSDDIFESWMKGKGNNKDISKFIKSCRPLQVEVGPFFVINQGSTFAALDTVVNFSITLLVEY